MKLENIPLEVNDNYSMEPVHFCSALRDIIEEDGFVTITRNSGVFMLLEEMERVHNGSSYSRDDKGLVDKRLR